jgi:hypothetical protein
MKLDDANPDNLLLIAHRRNLNPRAQPLAFPESNPYAYMNLGSHPDIVERVWVGLNSGLPVDCRAIVYGAPALVHPNAGVVFAMAYGTRYVLRIAEAFLPVALARGCTPEQTWSGGAKTDIGALFGPEWLFGNWIQEESKWLFATYERLENAFCRRA